MTLLLLLLQFSWADTPNSLVGHYPGQVLRNEVLAFKRVTDHHFSLEAPQNCGSGQVLDKSPRAIKCQFLSPGETTVTLNVCDDKKTFCKPNLLKVNVLSEASKTDPVLSKNQTLNRELHRQMVPGFIEGTPEEIGHEAKTRNQPIFVMVSTDWCPPCNQTKEYLLVSPGFQKAARNWFKVYVDGDSLGSAKWTATVPFRYFPSFALLNAKMEEVGRYTGNLRQGEFVSWAEQMQSHLNDPIPVLKARVKARRDGSFKQRWMDLWSGVKPPQVQSDEARLLTWALDMENLELVNELVGTSDFNGMESRVLRLRLIQTERDEATLGVDKKAEKISLLKRLLDLNLTGENWAEILSNLCETDKETCQLYFSKVQARIEAIKKTPGINEAELAGTLGDEYFYLAEAHQSAGDKKAVKEFALKCVDHFTELKKKTFLKTSRSGQQGMVACLEMAEDFKREEVTLKELIQAYPNEPTFLSRMARMLRKQKKYDQALSFIRRAEDLSYGYNWFSLQLIKAEVLLELGRKPEARQVVERALAQVSLDSRQESRNQNLVAKLPCARRSSLANRVSEGKFRPRSY